MPESARPTAEEVSTATLSSGRRRPLARARSQRLLITLLGDYWEDGREPIASAGLVRVLEEFGIAPANARAALSRLTQRGVLHRTKDGRRTSYAPTEQTMKLLRRGAHRIFSREDGTQWDGTWTLIAFSLAIDDGDLRRLLRARLRWLTFWPLYDATWVTPHDRLDAAREQLTELGITDALALRSADVQLLPGGLARLEAAWRLEELADAYRRYIARFRTIAERAAAGQVSPDEALVQRGELVDDWRLLVRDDPDLPVDFLPEGFPRPHARALFLETYAALATPACTRFEQLIASGNGT